MCMLYLSKLSHSSWIVCSIFYSLFPLCISVCDISIDRSSSLLIFPWPYPVYWWDSRRNHFYCSVFNFWHLLLILRVSISLLTLSICFCMLYTISNRLFSILIIVISNSIYIWPFQNLCHVWVWFWCLFCLLRLFLFVFSIPYNSFLLKARLDV